MNDEYGEHCYDDIIDLPHHRSELHPHMSMHDRAAQFAPFAALTGHEEAIKETARLTEKRTELSGDEKQRLNEKLREAADTAGSGRKYEITYFVPDERKSGGAYVTVSGSIRKIDPEAGLVLLTDRSTVPINEITEIKEEEP